MSFTGFKGPPPPAVRLPDAAEQRRDDIALTCLTCDSPSDDRWAPYCASCGIYWKDVAEGMFEDEYQQLEKEL